MAVTRKGGQASNWAKKGGRERPTSMRSLIGNVASHDFSAIHREVWMTIFFFSRGVIFCLFLLFCSLFFLKALLSWRICPKWIADTLMHFGKCGTRNRTKELQLIVFPTPTHHHHQRKKIILEQTFFYNCFHCDAVTDALVHTDGLQTSRCPGYPVAPACFRFSRLHFQRHIWWGWWCTLHSPSTSTSRSVQIAAKPSHVPN